MLENSQLDSDMKNVVKPTENSTSCSLQEPVKLRPYMGKKDDREIKTIPQFFHECCHKYYNRKALAFETFEENSNIKKWISLTYGEYEQKVEQTALMLLHLGVQPRTTVAILSYNCPEWFYIEWAALCIGAVVTGIYTTNSSEAVYHNLETSQASVCIVGDALQLSKVHEIKSRLKQLKNVIQIHGPFREYVDEVSCYFKWQDLYEMKFDEALREELLLREKNVFANECALLVFTSGTTGLPKAAMISHDNLLFYSYNFHKISPPKQQQQEIIVSYLPLNHIAAQLFDLFIATENGFLVYFADRNALKGTLMQTYQKANGTMLFGVPRVYEKVQEKLIQFETNSSYFSRFLTTKARSLMLEYHLDRTTGSGISQWKYWLSSMVLNKIKAALGLANATKCFAGGAPLSNETKRFFLSLDLPLIDVFGMSECCGAVTFNFEATNFLTIGKPIEGVELKIREPNEKGEGEILVKGPCNFMGYLKDPQKTKEIFTEDGWLKSGDLGYSDAEGNFYVSGRLKELITTAGGENIAPNHIEDVIKKELPCISNALVVGDNRKYLTVLLTLKTDIDNDTGIPLDTLRPEVLEWLESLDKHYKKLSELLNIQLPENLQNFEHNEIDIKCDPEVWLALEEGIKRYNFQAISNAQKVQYFAILPHDFSIATEELGPTLKIRRNIVLQKYAATIEKMYKN